jgi:hypothetical protein
VNTAEAKPAVIDTIFSTHRPNRFVSCGSSAEISSLSV